MSNWQPTEAQLEQLRAGILTVADQIVAEAITTDLKGQIKERLVGTPLESEKRLVRIKGRDASVIKDSGKTVNRCNYHFTNGRCRISQMHPRPMTIDVCAGCPDWTELDAMYENITGRTITHSYVWWRNQWIEGFEGHALPYALERMQSFVTVNTYTHSELIASRGYSSDTPVVIEGGLIKAVTRADQEVKAEQASLMKLAPVRQLVLFLVAMILGALVVACWQLLEAWFTVLLFGRLFEPSWGKG